MLAKRLASSKIRGGFDEIKLGKYAKYRQNTGLEKNWK